MQTIRTPSDGMGQKLAHLSTSERVLPNEPCKKGEKSNSYAQGTSVTHCEQTRVADVLAQIKRKKQSWAQRVMWRTDNQWAIWPQQIGASAERWDWEYGKTNGSMQG